ALRAARRRIGEHRYATPAHRQRLIDHRQGVAEVLEIPEADIGAVLGHHIGVHGDYATILAEANLDAALETGTATTDGVFLMPGDAHHHWTVDLARHVRRDRHLRIGVALRAKPAAAIFRDEDEVLGLDAAIAREARDRVGLALRGAEREHFAVLPIGHGR